MGAVTATCCYSLLLSSFLSSSYTIRAQGQGRAPHGLAYQPPMAFSPSAYEFFHHDPNAADQVSCDGCSPYPLAAQVRAYGEHQPSNIAANHAGFGGEITGVVVGIILLAAAAALAMGAVYYVVVTRYQDSMDRDAILGPVKSDA